MESDRQMAKEHQLGDTVDKAECVIWPGAKNGSGYPIKWHKGKARMYNRVLWSEHNGPIPKGNCICHKCDNPSCVNLDHLFLGSYSDNLYDMIKKGRDRHAFGSAHGLAVLNEEKVARMRKLAKDGVPRPDLVKMFGVSRTTVRKVITCATWKHVKP